MGAHGADRLVELDVVAVDRVIDPALDHGDDVGRGDRAEELALLACAGGDDERSAGDELRRDGLVLTLALGQAIEMRPLQRLGVAHSALLGLDREPPGDQVVARVAVGDLGGIPGVPELVDGLLQDDLHRLEYGSRAISRAFLTAWATSRWCCTQLPVTRRARILPRSEVNLRSVRTSL